MTSAPNRAARHGGQAGYGRVHHAKLEPAFRGHPSGRISELALRASSKSDSAITFNRFGNFMKPPPQISPDQRNSRCDNRTPDDSRNFPSTDYNFQSTTEACGSVSTISQEKLRTFWKLSSEFFSAENRRHHATELLLFALISGISAWPIISALVAVTRLVRDC